jgi:Mrp family chromosome partitioning ATPase/capsular polysaccharide biosynthesis protein
LLIAFITLLTVAGALAATHRQPSKYKATAAVVVHAQLLPSGGIEPADMVTEKQIALSGNVARRAADLLPGPSNDIRAGLSVSVPIDSDVLNISYTSSSARSAFIGASVYTRAYVAYRNQIASATSGAHSNLHPVTQVITPVAQPTAPIAPRYPLFIGLSLVIGLGLGFATALARDRLTGRVRNAEQIQDLVGHPVLGRISARAPTARRSGSVLTGFTAPGAEVYGQVAARFLREAQHVPTATLVVTSPVNGPGKSAVALNIAAALANSGRETVLVRPNSADGGSAERMNGSVRDDPAGGGSHPASPPMFRTQMPRLSVAAVDLNQLGPGESTNGAAGVAGYRRYRRGDTTAVPGLKASLLEMERSGRLIVVEADPLLGHQMTPLIAASADATIVVVDLHRESSRDLAKAGSVLEHADRVLGCIIYDSSASVWARLARRGHSNGSAPEIEPRPAHDQDNA